MSLTGPELDLLQEVLVEDPTADVFLDVARALMDRGDAREASRVLRRAVEHGATDPEAARLLARTASESGDHAGVRAAGEILGEATMRSEPVLARAWALALDQAGELDRAGALARQLLDAHGADPELQGVVDRQHAAPPDPSIRARDPFFTVSRAEAYLENGRIDLAVRTYRRILAENIDHAAVHARLLRLRAMPAESRPWVDDLSEEYWVHRAAPAAIAMPAPRLVPTHPPEPDDQATQPGAPLRGGVDPDAITPVTGRAEPPRALHDAALPPQGPAAPDPDEESTVLRREALVPVDDEKTVLMGRRQAMDLLGGDADAHSEPVGSSARSDEPVDPLEETVIGGVAPEGPPSGPPRRRLPGVDDIARALREDRASDPQGPAMDDGDDDEDSVEHLDLEEAIAQARAIERRAASRRADDER